MYVHQLGLVASHPWRIATWTASIPELCFWLNTEQNNATNDGKGMLWGNNRRKWKGWHADVRLRHSVSPVQYIYHLLKLTDWKLPLHGYQCSGDIEVNLGRVYINVICKRLGVQTVLYADTNTLFASTSPLYICTTCQLLVWDPYTFKGNQSLEPVQKFAGKLCLKCQDMEMLEQLDLTPLSCHKFSNCLECAISLMAFYIFMPGVLCTKLLSLIIPVVMAFLIM